MGVVTIMAWRDDVQVWLQGTAALAVYPSNWQSVGRSQRQSFPKSVLVVVAKWIHEAIAKWLIKNALQDAAKALGYQLSDAEAGDLASALLEVC
jgi:hypothetical protein